MPRIEFYPVNVTRQPVTEEIHYSLNLGNDMDHVIEEMSLETLESRLEMESVAALAAQPDAIFNCLCFQKN